MSINAMKRRIERLSVAGERRLVVVMQLPDETPAQLNRRVQVEQGSLCDRDLVVIIERIGVGAYSNLIDGGHSTNH